MEEQKGNDSSRERRLKRAQRLQREREMKERRKNLILRGVLFALLIGIMITIICIALKIGRSSNKRTDGRERTAAVQEATGTGTESAAASSAVSEAAPADEKPESVPAVSENAGTESQSGNTSELPAAVNVSAATDTPATKEDALASAALFAAQYDYDRAIAAIQSLAGYDSDKDLTDAIAKFTADKSACKAVDVTTIPHIFFHSLLNDDRGLRKDIVGEDRAWRNDAAMTTADEFDHMIQMMYEAGYVMVSLDDMCVKTKNADGSTSIAPNQALMLPEGKKAFVLSEDDLSYYHTYGIGTQGYATRMLIDENGEVKCEYTDENGVTKIGDYDVVPRMDTFVKEHPDFSYHGHKGTVALTGYNGVFGYRTNDYYKDINNPKLDPDQVQWLQDHPDFNWDQDVKDATAIADAMKATGWTFASHTYGHLNAQSRSAEQLKADNERWMTVNHPIVGDIDKIIFAFGCDIGPVNGYTSANDKYTYFKSQGYNIFCNVDGNIGWTEFGPQYMRTGRVPLDGFSMYQAMTPDAPSHGTYARDYEQLGIHDIASFFNKYRITPIDSE